MMDKTVLRRNHRMRWTLSELNFIEKHYGNMKTAAIAEHLGRSLASVRSAACLLGISVNSEPWTQSKGDRT